MEKFSGLSKLTKDYLDGKLVGLNFAYHEDNRFNILLTYQPNSYFTLDYEVEVNGDNRTVNFLFHGSKKGYDKVNLDDVVEFDQAVYQYLFSN
jgi:hypothetical protein